VEAGHIDAHEVLNPCRSRPFPFAAFESFEDFSERRD
jgi:hypothetical protein